MASTLASLAYLIKVRLHEGADARLLICVGGFVERLEGGGGSHFSGNKLGEKIVTSVNVALIL